MKILFIPLLLCGVVAANAQQLFVITLTGDQEVPPNSSSAIGSGTASLDLNLGLSINVSFSGLSAPASACHLHVTATGADYLMANFDSVTPQATSGTIIGSTSSGFGPGVNYALMHGLGYLDIHDNVYPDGEIRGWLTPVPEPSSLVLLGFALSAAMLPWRRQ